MPLSIIKQKPPPQVEQPDAIPRARPAPRALIPALPNADPVAGARAAGIVAVWTGDCSGTVELARLAGPHEGIITAVESRRLGIAGITGSPPLHLSAWDVRVVLYEHCLTSGTQFDIYRWINLTDLARVWCAVALPAGVRAEWGSVLRASRLL